MYKQHRYIAKEETKKIRCQQRGDITYQVFSKTKHLPPTYATKEMIIST